MIRNLVRRFSIFAMIFAATAGSGPLISRAATPATNAGPVKVIFDTDMDTDCDDVAALCLLHVLADRGEAEILATVVSTKSQWTAPCVAAIDQYYGRGDLPIGGPRSSTAASNRSKYTRQVAQSCPHRNLGPVDQLPAAVEIYRTVLEAQPDGSVVIITVGALTNIAELLQLPATGTHPSGLELVKHKVHLWACMGGNFMGNPPKDDMKLTNWNFTMDPNGSLYAVKNWPVSPARLMFVGRQIGSIPSGLKVGKKFGQLPADHPLRLAYQCYFNGTARDRHVADPTTVLYAVRGLQDFWTEETRGYMDLQPNMQFEWKYDQDKQQGYLQKKLVDGKPNDLEVEETIENLCLQPPSGAATQKSGPERE